MMMQSAIDLEAEFIRKRPQLEYQIAKRVGCSEIAADLATEIYLKLKRINPVCYSEGEAWTYLFHMAKSAAIDHVRTVHRREALLNRAVDLVEPEQTIGPDRRLAAADQIKIIEGALAELPEKARAMLMLSRVQGLTHGEIANELGVSKSLVEKYIARALLHCRARMVEIAQREAEREAALDSKKPGWRTSAPHAVTRSPAMSSHLKV